MVSWVGVHAAHESHVINWKEAKVVDWAETSGKNCDNRHLSLDFLGQ